MDDLQAHLERAVERAIERAIQKAGWKLVERVQSTGPAPEGQPISRSWLAPDGSLFVPLEIENERLGWLRLKGQRPSLKTVQTLELLADQAALTLQLSRDMQRQQVLNQIAHTISQHLEIEELFSAVTEQIQAIFPIQRASITLREGRRPASKIFALDERRDVEKAASPLEEIAFEQIFQQQHGRIIRDLAEEADLPAEKALAEQGIRSYACLPLTMWRQVIASFNMASEQPGTFKVEDASFLIQIADHLAGAVWNALLYEVEQQRRHTADALAQLSKIVNSTLELNEVLKLALEQIERVIDYDSASILLYDSNTSRLTIRAARGFEHPETLIGASFQIEENNISHQVMKSRQARVVDDVQKLPEWGHNRDDIEGAHTIRGWMGFPLLVRDQSIGLLVMDKFEAGFFTEEDRENLSAFAAQVATAIHNARMYQGLQEQRNKLSAILTDTSDAVIVLDLSNRIWLINPAAAHYLKLDADQVVGQSIDALNLPELNAALASGAATQEVMGQDQRSFQASITPVHDVGIVIVMQDITPLKQLDRLRTEWVAAVSHDLKNPIQVVQLGAVLLQMDGPLNELQLDRIMIIQRSATQLSDLVTNVLDLARLEAGPALQLARVDLNEVIRGAATEIEHLATRKAQQIQIEIAGDLPSIQGDRALLGRVVANLLSNAIKYTPEGGTIGVYARNVHPYVEIDVIDNGAGIPAEALPHLFDRFYRVPGTQAEGTGLGLSIVKSIVEKHKGTVTVQSAPGEGSTFTLRLPC